MKAKKKINFNRDYYLEVEGSLVKKTSKTPHVVNKSMTTKQILLNFIEVQSKANEEARDTRRVLFEFIEMQKKANEEARDTRRVLFEFIEMQKKANEEARDTRRILLEFIKKQEKFNSFLLSLPTIKKEINELKK